MNNIAISSQEYQANRKVACKCNYVKSPKPLVVQNGNMASNWRLWRLQYEWFEKATQMKAEPAKVQILAFLLSIGAEAIDIFNTFNLSVTKLTDVNALKTRFQNLFTLNENVQGDIDCCKSEKTSVRLKKQNGSEENRITKATNTIKDESIKKNGSSDEISVSYLLESLCELKKVILIDSVHRCISVCPVCI